jgi:hypothetical protein
MFELIEAVNVANGVGMLRLALHAHGDETHR